MKLTALLFPCCSALITSAAFADHYNNQPFPVSTSTTDGYREVYCPAGTVMQSCQIDTAGYSCDNIKNFPQGNVCGADSHKKRLCNITAWCARPVQPHYQTYTNSVVATDGVVTCQRPGEQKAGRCSFWGSCDNQRELQNGCYADSHHSGRCNMSVTCVSYY